MNRPDPDAPFPEADASGLRSLRGWIAVALLWSGRALLVLGVVAVVVCRQTRSVWQGAPHDSGGVPDHWIPQTTFLVSFAWSLLLPILVLPVGSAALVDRIGQDLRVRTVLGTRRVQAEHARARAIRLPGRRYDSRLLVLRDARGRRAIIAASGLWQPERGEGNGTVIVSGHRIAVTSTSSSPTGWAYILGGAVLALVLFTVMATSAGV